MLPPKAVQDWLNKAVEDEQVIRALRTANGPWPPAAYHAQQAAEKYAKAVLVAAGTEPPYSHDVALLLSMHSGAPIPADVDTAANTITSFVALTRYPGFAPVSKTDFETAETEMMKIKAWCLDEIARLCP